MSSAPRTVGARRRSSLGAPRLTLVVRNRAGSEVTPAYVRRLAHALEDVPAEIFVADETLRIGSTDLLAAARIEQISVKVFRARAAVAEAVAASAGEYVALIDADERHPPELIPELLFQSLSSDIDVMIASRGADAPRVRSFRDLADPGSSFFMARKALVLSVLPKPGRTLLALDVLLSHPRASVAEIPIARAARPEAARPPLRRRIEIARHVASLTREKTAGSLRARLAPFGIPAMFAVAGIIALAAVLRFWALPHLHFYGQDESHASFAAWRMIHEHRPVLTGQPTSRGVYLGPGYYYLVAPFYLLFGGSPFAGAFLAALTGVGATYLVWRIARETFSVSAGLTAAIIFATAPIAVYLGRFGWNPNTLPFFAALFLFALIRGTPRWIAVAAFCAGLAPQLHASGLILPVMLVVWLATRRPALRKRAWLGTAFAFGLPVIPMAVAEIHSRFAGVKSWVRLLVGHGSAGVNTGGSIVKAFKDLFVESIGTPRFTVAAILVAIAILGVIALERRIWNDPVKGPAFRTLATFEIFGVFAAFAWHGQMFAYWLLPWLPGAIVLFAAGLIEACRWIARKRHALIAAAAAIAIGSFNVAAVAHPVRLDDQFDSASPAAFRNVDAASRWIAGNVHGSFQLQVWTPYPWDSAHSSTGAFDYLLMRRGLERSDKGRLFVVAMEDVATPHVRFVRKQVLDAFAKRRLIGAADFGGLSVYEFA